MQLTVFTLSVSPSSSIQKLSNSQLQLCETDNKMPKRFFKKSVLTRDNQNWKGFDSGVAETSIQRAGRSPSLWNLKCPTWHSTGNFRKVIPFLKLILLNNNYIYLSGLLINDTIYISVIMKEFFSSKVSAKSIFGQLFLPFYKFWTDIGTWNQF